MISKVTLENIDQLTILALKLWPEEIYSNLYDDFKESLEHENEESFLYVDDKGVSIGFIQLSLRKEYVEGSESSPVAYIEGIYVEKEFRRAGIAKELAVYAEQWGLNRGCTQIGSDCELNNTLSIDFHKAVGFDEANRLVCFMKRISNNSN